MFYNIPQYNWTVKLGEKKSKQEEEVHESKYDLQFRRGDLLEVPRTLFIHFGIYLGGGRVAHFIPDIMPVISSDPKKIQTMVTNTRLILGVILKRGSVRVDSVEDFAYGSEILVNPTDKVCSSHPPLDPETVALRAERLKGQVPYSLLWFNCEHYVMYCRYGTSMSFQTFQFCKTVRKLVLSRVIAKVMWLLGAGLVLYVHAALSPCTLLLLVLVPFLVWMAS
ncbi:lecithin retinol acyltransferase-like isoform X2 [Boleophthalmus pectinirostris]|uniref:lecithin retinol acyltransferase-like isoform X2 n=1 Tax=Boleophthalmus pectinirostris TaxID=150288 RepID=UPI002431156A|nr:lecithin retinol acyltransferase-like isoform X2 [Boleophthalmus pectinirostris]